jgi:hypothetical protein
MKRLVITVAAVALLANASPQPPMVEGCRLRIGVAIGCVGDVTYAPQNAADMFAEYGLNKADLSSPATSAYVQRFQCLRLTEHNRPLTYGYMGNIAIATRRGAVTVRFVQVSGDADPNRKPMLFIAEPYFIGICPRLNQNHGAADNVEH